MDQTTPALPSKTGRAGAPPAVKSWRGGGRDSAFGRGRAVLFGGLALALALHAQKLIVDERVAHAPAVRWYAAAVVLMIIAWVGTYRNKSFLLLPLRPPAAGVQGTRRAGAARGGQQPMRGRAVRRP